MIGLHLLRRRVLPWCLLIFLFTHVAPAKVLDNGVDPENLGTGDWIYVLSAATRGLGGNVSSVTDVPSLMKFYREQGISFVAVKAGTGATDFPKENPQFTKELVEAAHAEGIKIFGYTRSDGKDVPGEIALARKIYNLGADGFIIDAEAEWEAAQLGDKGPELAIQLCEGIKREFPNKFLGHAPFPVISRHATFPYKEFGYYCDAVMPQNYWKSIGVSSKRMVDWMDEEWHQWQNSLTGRWKKAIKPIAPIGQGWDPAENKIVSGLEVMQFVAALNHDKNPVTPGGYKGVSYWRADLHTERMWKGISRAKIGDPSSTPESLLENIVEPEPVIATTTPAATPAKVENANDFVLDDSNSEVEFSGAWYIGKQKNGFYGSSYRCANAVKGEPTATATFHPLIRNTGYYDIYVWFRDHKNYSKSVPWIINYKGDSFTNLVDQTVEGNDWRLLASGLHFSSGTDVTITVGNNSGERADRVIIADAVRFVRKEGEAKGGE